MGRKKSYSKNPGHAKREPAADADAQESDGGVPARVPAPGDTVIVTTAEVAEMAALTAGTPAPAPEPAGPQALTGRPEWALVAPARLEAAEEESFWFALALAVMACAPPMLGAPAALVAAALCFRLLRALWSVPSDVAPEDLSSARMTLFMTVLMSVVCKLNMSNPLWGIAWMMSTVFFFNALRNVRTMVGLALTKGGPKKKKGAKEIEEKKA